jgi:hypothetical protein
MAMIKMKWLLVTVVLLAAGCSGRAYPMASKTFLPDFLANSSPRIQEAYQFAVANQHELAKYPCYCGCVYMGHESNLGCYIDPARSTSSKLVFDQHAVGCGVCVDITHDVMRLLSEGKTSPEIRTYIDATYSRYGPGTNTPLPAS